MKCPNKIHQQVSSSKQINEITSPIFTYNIKKIKNEDLGGKLIQEVSFSNSFV